MAKGFTLTKAKTNKDNEYYTLYDDIQNELNYYTEHFNNKVVFCNCDDPFESNFFRFFIKNFNFLKLKRLICTCYKGSPVAFTKYPNLRDENNKPIKKDYGYIIDISSVPMSNGKAVTDDDIANLLSSKSKGVKNLKGDGDFKSDECIEYLKQADIVCTNPPFSEFHNFLPLLIKYKKKFLIIGDKNQIVFEDVFPLFINNKVWIGYTRPNHFLIPSGEITNKMQGRIRWFTNLDINKRNELYPFYKKFNKEENIKLENFDAYTVGAVSDIPDDKSKIFAVPITFLDSYNPKQFDILGCTSCISLFGLEWKKPSQKFFNLLENGKVRTKGNYQKSKPCWIDSEGLANVGYHRIFVKVK